MNGILAAMKAVFGAEETKVLAEGLVATIRGMRDRKQKLGAIEMVASVKKFEAGLFLDILNSVEGDSIPKGEVMAMFAASNQFTWGLVQEVSDEDGE